MIYDNKQPCQMNCEEALLLMVPMWANELSVDSSKRQAFKRHILVCRKCSEEFHETKEIMYLVKEHWGPVSSHTYDLLQKAGYLQEEGQKGHLMTAEEGWQDLLSRCPDLASSVKRQKFHRWLLRAIALAACLVIGISIFFAFSNYSKPGIAGKPVPQQFVSIPESSIKLKQVSSRGNILLPADQMIISANELKTLVINEKHQIVMNTNTVLSIEPFVMNNLVGCLVKLNYGQIFTNVEKDGNPFIVTTPHGKAVITGTTFDIKVDKNNTSLVVTEGTVRFESDKGFVNVKTGQYSVATGSSAPSEPVYCNASELTKWATDNKAIVELGKAQSYQGEDDLPLPLEKEPIVLEKIDYRYWIDQKRDWFKQQFPYIFQLKDALAKEGIEVDYPELLIKTGDQLQFIWMEAVPPRYCVPNPDSLLKTAVSYGLEKEWVLSNILPNIPEKPVPIKNNMSSQALDQWLKEVESADEPNLKSLSDWLGAAVYLTETRSLTWFAINNGSFTLSRKDRLEILTLLQEEVQAACLCENSIRKIYLKNKQGQRCGENEYKQLISTAAENIRTIISAEERFLEYEIGK